MEYIREHKKGLIGSAIYHGILLLLFILFGFITPLPLPGEQGILVNFGDSETGLGETEPSPAVNIREPVTTMEQEEQVPVTPPEVVEKQKPEPAKEENLTQDLEKTAALEAAKKEKGGGTAKATRD